MVHTAWCAPSFKPPGSEQRTKTNSQYFMVYPRTAGQTVTAWAVRTEECICCKMAPLAAYVICDIRTDAVPVSGPYMALVQQARIVCVSFTATQLPGEGTPRYLLPTYFLQRRSTKAAVELTVALRPTLTSPAPHFDTERCVCYAVVGTVRFPLYIAS